MFNLKNLIFLILFLNSSNKFFCKNDKKNCKNDKKNCKRNSKKNQNQKVMKTLLGDLKNHENAKTKFKDIPSNTFKNGDINDLVFETYNLNYILYQLTLDQFKQLNNNKFKKIFEVYQDVGIDQYIINYLSEEILKSIDPKHFKGKNKNIFTKDTFDLLTKEQKANLI